MRRLRPVLAVAAVLAATAAVPAGARVATPVELTSTTVVSTARSGYVDVVLPSDARLSPKATGNPDVHITGGGRFLLPRRDSDHLRHCLSHVEVHLAAR
jgi:hypothetical protein